MSRSLQYKLPGLNWKTRITHGGSEAKGNPRERRPIDTKQALHVVLRSSMARGDRSLLARLEQVEKTIQRQADLFGIKIYQCSTPGNHVHMLLKVKRRRNLGRFLRSVSGLLARIALKAERGHSKLGALSSGMPEKFWDSRPWSRIVHFGRDFSGVLKYIQQNILEAWGFSRLDAKAQIASIEKLLRAGKITIPGFA